MNIFSISCIFVAIFPTLLGLFLFLKREKKEAVIFGWVCLLVGLWGFAGYKFSTTASKEIAFFWWQIGYIAPILNPVIYYHFVYAYLKLKKRYFKYLLFSTYGLGIIFLIFNLFFPELFLGDLRFVFNQFYWHDWIKNKNIAWLFFYVTFWWFLLIYSFSLLLKAYKDSKVVKKNQLRYLIFGSAVGWLGGALTYLCDFHIDIYFFTAYLNNFLFAFYPFILAYAILKYHLMDIRIAITSTGIFTVLYAFLLGVPFYVGYQTESWVLAALFAFVFATIGPIIYRLLQKKAEDILLAHQRHYQHLLLQAAGGMTREHSLKRLFKLIVYIVKKAVGIEFAAVYGRNKERKTYSLKASRDKNSIFVDKEIKEKSPLISYIRNASSPFMAEEMPHKLRTELEQTLGRRFGLVIPSVIEKDLLGFLILGEKLDKSAYSQDDINVFGILSNQAALAMENCIFFEEFKKAQDRIFEAEKLASIGGMADGVAHQIKNRLNHFSVASGELKIEIDDLAKKIPQLTGYVELKKSYDYIKQVADSLLDNVRRTDDVVKGILNYSRATQKEPFFSYFSLKETIELSLGLLKVKHKLSEFPLEYNLGSVDAIYGIKSQITEAIYNLLDNAYEATLQFRNTLSSSQKENYRSKITISAKEESNSFIISVSDNGIGIKDKDSIKIFSPFFTTKSSFRPMDEVKSGTGIGMYIIKRLVEENHKGKIWFESQYKKGSTFYIRLPKKKESHS